MRVIGGSQKAFAMPVVLTTSLVMMMVLFVSLAGVTSMSTLLQDQYVNKLVDMASESGANFAKACLVNSNGVVTWSDSTPLRYGTDCNGAYSGSFAGCTATSTTSTCNLIVAGNLVGNYAVGNMVKAANGEYVVSSQGEVDMVRTSDSTKIVTTQTRALQFSSTYVATPQLTGGSGFAGTAHDAYYIDETGKLYGWGDNRNKQIYSGSNVAPYDYIETPMLMTLPAGVTSVLDVVPSGYGGKFVCIRGNDTTIWCRGEPGDVSEVNGIVPYGTGAWVQFRGSVITGFTNFMVNAQGDDSICGIHVTDFNIFCAGENRLNMGSNQGALGTSNQSSNGIAVGSALKFKPSGTTTDYKKIYVQDRLTCGINSIDELWCEGVDGQGMLGDGTPNSPVPNQPQKYTLGSGYKALDVITSYHSWQTQTMHVLKSTGTVSGPIMSSGQNLNGEIGDGTTTQRNNPTQFGANTDFTAMLSVGVGVTADANATFCGIRSNGEVWCSGDNSYGQLNAAGVTTCTSGTKVATPTKFRLPVGEVAKTVLTPTSRHMRDGIIVLTQANHIYSAGLNRSGRFALGSVKIDQCVTDPTMATYANGVAVEAQSISTLDDGTLFFMSVDGRSYAVGSNINGQIGDGTTTDRYYPTLISIPRRSFNY